MWGLKATQIHVGDTVGPPTYICPAFMPYNSLLIDFKICLRNRNPYDSVVHLPQLGCGFSQQKLYFHM